MTILYARGATSPENWAKVDRVRFFYKVGLEGIA